MRVEEINISRLRDDQLSRLLDLLEGIKHWIPKTMPDSQKKLLDALEAEYEKRHPQSNDDF